MFWLLANPHLDSHCGSPFRSSTYMDEPFKSTHHFIALSPSLDICIQGWCMPAPWQDTPIIALFGLKINDYSMRVRSSFVGLRRRPPSGRFGGPQALQGLSFCASYSGYAAITSAKERFLREASPPQTPRPLGQLAFERHGAAQLDHLVAQSC